MNHVRSGLASQLGDDFCEGCVWVWTKSGLASQLLAWMMTFKAVVASIKL